MHQSETLQKSTKKYQQMVVFCSRKHFIEYVYQQMGLLNVYQEFPNDYMISWEHFSHYRWSFPQMMTPLHCDSSIKRNKQSDGRVNICPIQLHDIDEKYYFTKSDDHFDTLSAASRDMMSTPNRLWFEKQNFKKFTLCKTSEEFYKAYYSQFGLGLFYEQRSIGSDYGWYRLTSFDTSPDAAKDESLAEFKGHNTFDLMGIIKIGKYKELDNNYIKRHTHIYP